MSNNQVTVKDFFNKDGVKKKFEEMLGKRSTGFITSVMQVVSGNNYLSTATPESVYGAAAMAAALDLPINNSLGFAWIVPYNTSVQENGQWVKKVIAQFQIGWKGFVQLAQRTGQYKRINVVEVYENQFISYNKLTEDLNADFTVEGAGKIVGYVAYFQLINGFEKLNFWSSSEVTAHGKRFSKTFDKKDSVWQSDFDGMAKKTVLKNTLSKWGILSIEMQQAIVADQSVIENPESEDVDYVDCPTDNINSDSKALEKPIMTPELLSKAIESVVFEGVDPDKIKQEYECTAEQIKQLNEAIPK